MTMRKEQLSFCARSETAGCVERGLRSRDEARKMGKYVSSADVLKMLDEKLAMARDGSAFVCSSTLRT
jgi:hypothetical protein